MRTINAVIISSVSLGLMFQGCESPPKKQAGAKPDTFPVKQAVAEVNAAVTEYTRSEAGQKSQMGLKEAEFTFKVVETVTGEVGVNILILNVSGSVAGQRTKEVTYSYKKPTTIAALVVQPSLKSDLAKTIDKAIRSKVDEVGGIPINGITIQSGFGIERKIGAGGQVQFSIVTVGPKVSASNNTAQSIKLVFAKKT
jgi:hypothetical protein